MKKRIGIFVFYNEYGIVEDYVIYLLESMKEILNQLVIVINGQIQEQGLHILNEFSSRVYTRENNGYDAEAYKEAILSYIPNQELQEYDELVLFNHTFYGPFGSWIPIFQGFEQIETDFWGLSKWISGSANKPGYSFLLEHIQSYFLVIRKQILRDKSFYSFWEQMILPMSYHEAIRNFEVGFTAYFKNHNFHYKTWIEVTDGDKYLEPGEVIFIDHAGDLVTESSFPIMKRKAISLVGFGQVLKVLDYVKRNRVYSENLIRVGITQYECSSFPYQSIENFYLKHRHIYVFGYGKWGHGLESYFQYKGWKIQAFVVTKRKPEEKNVLELDELEMNRKDGLIVALGQEQCEQIVPFLKKCLKDRDILLPESCKF